MSMDLGIAAISEIYQVFYCKSNLFLCVPVYGLIDVWHKYKYEMNERKQEWLIKVQDKIHSI